MIQEKALVWFRRDLRDHDHAALSAALSNAREVHCAFIFDTDILDALPSRQDRRVQFIRESLVELDAALRARGGGLIVRHGRASEEIPNLARELGVASVYANRDYEPAALRRDADVILRSSLNAVLPDEAVRRALEHFHPQGRVFLVAAGKAAWQMAHAALAVLDELPTMMAEAEGGLNEMMSDAADAMNALGSSGQHVVSNA